eukprot:6214774-Pleurochrysis_carterae.AAC.5
MISALHDDSATEGCFFDAHEIAAWLYINTYSDVECFVAQSESEKASTDVVERSNLRPTGRWWERYIRTRCAAFSSSGVGQLMARQSIPTANATSGLI